MENNRRAEGPRVLDGVRVLDFTAVIAGPYCTRMMADLGAEVLKVETFEGDLVRFVEPLRGKTSAMFSALNSGKKSLSLDLKNAEATNIVRRLVPHYDVVVENFSPGVMRRLGLNYEILSAENSRLIMCSISGFGQTGPGAERPAYAPIVQAYSGYEDVTRRAQGGLEKPLNMGLPVGDTSASLQALGAINAALFYRERTGIGQYIDISMLDTVLSTMAKDFQMGQLPGTPDRKYGPVATKDGYIIVMPLNPRHFESLAVCIEQPDLVDDPRFSTTTARIRNYDQLYPIVEAWSTTHQSADALAKLEAAKIPCGPYLTISEVANDPQLTHRNMITAIEDAEGELRAPNTPFLFSETHAAVQPKVAQIGEHNEEILCGNLGLSAAEFAHLRDSGVVGPSPS
ncbi:MAG: CaiB/BaiF CoA-transferase family protein [Pseudomonadota bacterium]